MQPDADHTTRLAPSPTGGLHLGNARTFLVNWALAQQRGWRTILRIEDLDASRVKPGSTEAAIDVLRWLGLTWDGEPIVQSHDLAPYRNALASLASRRLAYPCGCTRREIAVAASAPHAEDGEVRYPGTCRNRQFSAAERSFSSSTTAQRTQERCAVTPAAETPVCWRLHVTDGPVVVRDELLGVRSFDVQAEAGDFVIYTKAALPAYQLAVVVDDARQGVTDVVRGDDLLPSAARQALLYDMLGLGPPPRYYHLPLVIGRDGKRLAKRNDDLRLDACRARGIGPQRIVGLIAYWCGVSPERREMSAAEFAAAFALDTHPRSPVTFTREDDEWLAS